MDEFKQAAKVMGRKGGKSKSEAKLKAIRENLKKAQAARAKYSRIDIVGHNGNEGLHYGEADDGEGS